MINGTKLKIFELRTNFVPINTSISNLFFSKPFVTTYLSIQMKSSPLDINQINYIGKMNVLMTEEENFNLFQM